MKDYQLGVYEKSMPEELDWRERLSIAKECGFDFLELSIDETDQRLARLEWTLEERLELLNLTKKLGMPIRSICLSGHRRYPLGHKDLEMQKRSLEIGYKAVDFASDLGIRIIQLAGYDVYYDEGDAETEQNFAKNLRLMTEYAASKEVTLGFETMETPFMDTVEKAMHYVNLIQNAWLGVYPDIGNLTNAAKIYKNEVNADLLKGKGHIFASHLKETIPGHYREIPFGTGHTEFVKNIECLAEMGIRSFVGEFWYVGQADWKKDVIFANEFLREKLDQVF